MKITNKQISEETLQKFFDEMDNINTTLVFPLDQSDVTKFVSDNFIQNIGLVVNNEQENIYSKTSLCAIVEKDEDEMSVVKMAYVDIMKLPRVDLKAVLSAKYNFNMLDGIVEIYNKYFDGNDLECYLYDHRLAIMMYI